MTFIFLATFDVDAYSRRRAGRKTTFYLSSHFICCNCSRPYYQLYYYIIYLYYNLWFFISKMVSKTYKQKLRKRRNYWEKKTTNTMCMDECLIKIIDKWLRCNYTAIHFERWPRGGKNVHIIIMEKKLNMILKKN